MTQLLPSSSLDPAAFARFDGAHAHLGKVHAILSRCYGAASREAVVQSQRAIRENLERHGISFEGKRLRVALTPTLLARAEIEKLAPAGAKIRAALLAVVARFLDEHRAVARADAPLHRFFAPYARWWDLVAAEARKSEAIQLMRYDAVREDRGRWQLLETNTCCPGGTIHCARVRTAWLASPLGQEATAGVSLVEQAVDRADGFLRHLHQLAGATSDQQQPRIAICSYRGFYQNEVASLVAEQARLIAAGELAGVELVIGDARELVCDGDIATLRGQRVDLIYNKLDPLMVDPRDPELAGWLRAVASPRVELVNSLAAMYLTETKRVLALLRDEDLRADLGLDGETRAAIDALVPRSYVLPPPQDGAAVVKDLLGDRHRYVLKADASTRGAGIYIGRELSPAAWAEAIEATFASDGIVQECVDIPHRLAADAHAETELATDADADGQRSAPLEEYWGVDLFYFGDQFGGCVSRCHSGMVFNVGNGGKEAPALVIA